MGWLSVLMAAGAAWLFRSEGQTLWMWVSVAVAIGCLWSWGVMHNFATNSAKQRASYRGGFFDFTEADVDAVPDGIAALNMLFTLAALAALIGAGFSAWA